MGSGLRERGGDWVGTGWVWYGEVEGEKIGMGDAGELMAPSSPATSTRFGVYMLWHYVFDLSELRSLQQGNHGNTA